MRYLEIIEVRDCPYCQAGATQSGETCLTCDGLGTQVREHRIQSLLDMNELLADIYRSNLKEEEKR